MATPTNPTDEQLLAIVRNAIASGAGTVSYTYQGKTVTRTGIKDLWALAKELESRIADANSNVSNTGIIRARTNFGYPW